MKRWTRWLALAIPLMVIGMAALMVIGMSLVLEKGMTILDGLEERLRNLWMELWKP